jgi:hypothetical protein
MAEKFTILVSEKLVGPGELLVEDRRGRRKGKEEIFEKRKRNQCNRVFASFGKKERSPAPSLSSLISPPRSF